MHDTTDILISGGGVAGLTAAAAFGACGHRVTLIEAACALAVSTPAA